MVSEDKIEIPDTCPQECPGRQTPLYQGYICHRCPVCAVRGEEYGFSDFRDRCKRCRKLIKGKLRVAQYEQYKPYCSYHCQEWAKLEDAQAYINILPSKH